MVSPAALAQTLSTRPKDCPAMTGYSPKLPFADQLLDKAIPTSPNRPSCPNYVERQARLGKPTGRLFAEQRRL